MGNIFSVSISCDQLTGRLCNCFSGDRALCMHKLEENLDDLDFFMQELKELLDDVMRRVNIDEDRGLQRLPQVQGWVSRVESLKTKVDELFRARAQEINRLCSCGYCSKNCISSYKYGKKVAKKLREVKDLTSKGDFPVVADTGPATLVDERPTEPTVGVEEMLDEVWARLMEDRVGILGLYGMGGVGKTTLLTQIKNKFRDAQNNFDSVMWVVVSKDLQLERIQEDIGKKLGLLGKQWEHKKGDEKTLNIFNLLRKKKFALLLDDIWTRVDLTKIGVPIPNRENGCKVVFTTRSQEVCGCMGADVAMEVKCLKWDDAWNLFQRKVGESTLGNHADIPDLAKIIARKCRGLPLALSIIGGTMACKRTKQEWLHAVNVLTRSASKFSGMEDEILPLLKFSYDNLKSEKAKSCFLYCTLFPENFDINKEELIDYLIGEDILDGYEDRNKTVNHGYDAIGSLVNACLLMEGEENCVKMHAVIREMALWIACEGGKEKESFIVQAGAQLHQMPNVKNWRGVRRISLMNNELRI